MSSPPKKKPNQHDYKSYLKDETIRVRLCDTDFDLGRATTIRKNYRGAEYTNHDSYVLNHPSTSHKGANTRGALKIQLLEAAGRNLIRD
jgi:hypothetical protein